MSEKDWGKIKEENDLVEEQEAADKIIEDIVDSEQVHADPSLSSPSRKELEDMLTAAEQKAHENWEKATRALAELENGRRLAEREMEKARLYGVKNLIDSLIPILDSLDQALLLAEKDENTGMVEGLQLTMKLFADTFNKFGVKELNPLGEPFDPQLHEAMAMQESDEHAPNTVMNVFQKGYQLHDRVIRPARVVVVKAK